MTSTAVKPVVAVVGGSGAVGGTQKAAALLAGGLASRGYPVHFMYDEAGPWTRHAEACGVRLVRLAPTPGAYQAFLSAVRPAILHQHVSGQVFDNPVYPALRALPPGPRPALIETNVFGSFDDREADRWGVRRLFVSRSSCVQAFRRSGRPLTRESLATVAVLVNPVLSAPPLSSGARATLRAEMGVRPEEILAIRAGRPDPRKWAEWECLAFRLARRRNARLRLLLVEPPEPLKRRVLAGAFGPGIRVHPVVSDSGRLNALYAASDLMVHAARFGESFGYTIAEAMAAGLPLVSLTTPYGDNAQVELVENGLTGWTCRSVGEMARRWLDLAADPRRRAALGEAGRERIMALAGLEGGLDVLEAAIREALTGEAQPLLAAVRRDLVDFAADFPLREQRVSEPGRVWESFRFRAYGAYRRLRNRAGQWLAPPVQPAAREGPHAELENATVTLNEPARIAILADGAIGGMQKAAMRYAVALSRAGLSVDVLATGEGPWTRFGVSQGVRVSLIPREAGLLARALLAIRPHVIHQHVSGYDPASYHYRAYEEVSRRLSFRVIESMVFGRLEDWESERWVDFRFFKSATSLIGANRRAGRPLTGASLYTQGVLYNPVEIPAPLPDPERQAFRRELGLDGAHRLVVRTGRPDPRKWADWECRAFQAARRIRPELRLVLIEPPRALRQAVERGAYGGGIRVLPVTEDFAWLARLYQSADIMLHASFFGESFGYSLAEGMAAGLPLIVRSTPYGDNAQVELVENGVTGWVCASVPEMARRLVDLAGDAGAATRMGGRGRERIFERAGSETGVALLRAVIDQVLEGRRSPVLDRQREALLRQAVDFDVRQWHCSEGLGRHSLDYAGGRLYAAYRTLRSGARHLATDLPGFRPRPPGEGRP